MSEKIPIFENPLGREEGVKITRTEMARLVRESFPETERLPFPGIKRSSYAELKEAERDAPPFLVTIDEILERCTMQGIKIIFTRGSVYFVPFDVVDVGTDRQINLHTVRIDYLDPDTVSNELRLLIQLSESVT